MMAMLITLAVVIISQCKHISIHPIVPFNIYSFISLLHPNKTRGKKNQCHASYVSSRLTYMYIFLKQQKLINIAK